VLVYLTYSSGFEKQTINFTFSIKLGLGDRWFGCKVVSMVRADPSARDIITYFNEDPIDLTTDVPKNDEWKKYFEFTHILVKDQSKLYHIPGAEQKVHGTITS
jgi:hypothetical protein